jgi:hypothetical protein
MVANMIPSPIKEVASMHQIEKLKAKLFEKPVRNDMTFAEVEP